MSSVDDHRWPVCAANMTTGAARTWLRMPRPFHVGWALSSALYTFLACICSLSVAGFAVWEVFSATVSAAAWAVFCYTMTDS